MRGEKLRIAIVSVLIALLVGSAIFAVAVRSYTVSLSVESAFAIWNDDALVVFVPRRAVGSSATLLQQLIAPLSRWTGMRAGVPRVPFSTDGIILRVENGVLRTSRHAPWSPPMPRPRFVGGRLLIFGGVWNGHQIDTLDRNEYIRLMASSEPDDAGGWHSEFLLRGSAITDVPVRIRGESLTLRGSRSADGVTIDLVRDPASSMRLIEVRFAPRAVSVGEFESTFSGPGVR